MIYGFTMLPNQNYFQQNLPEIIETYKKFLSFESISADPAKLSACRNCAAWLQEYLTAAGLSVELWNNGSHPPVIFAETPHVAGPTVLIYNHYDVQPVDPLHEWHSPPFSPIQEGNKVLARGASDNKGQCMYTLLMLKAFNQVFPCNLKIIIEGEEESGSVHLGAILAQHKSQVQADYVMVIDLGIRKRDQPAITLGTRGLLSLTLEVETAHEDLHSGCHGGLNFNSLHALVYMLSKARGENGKILIPGFYDHLLECDEALLSTLCLEFDPLEYESQVGCAPTGGEVQYSHLERNWLRPTLEINGIHGGYGGAGSKTVIPAKALAKLSCRLVPGQDPVDIGHKIEQFFHSVTPQGVKATCTIHEGHGIAVRTTSSSPIIKALHQAMKVVFNKEPEFVLEGASIPIVPELQQATGAQVAMWGLGLGTDKIHAPNEEFDLERMEKGFLTLFDAIKRVK